jgi:hypothetical protein
MGFRRKETVMNKIILIMLLALASLGVNLEAAAQGIMLNGVMLEETAHVGTRNLLLNGAGVRSKYIFDVYVAALYLREKKSREEDVFADPGEKRIALYFVSEINMQELLYVFKKAFKNNHSNEQLDGMKMQLRQFDDIFTAMEELNEGDVVQFDYQPDLGTTVRINGSTRGTISGAEFYRALLRIWLGSNPTQEKLKQKLLGVQ